MQGLSEIVRDSNGGWIFTDRYDCQRFIHRRAAYRVVEAIIPHMLNDDEPFIPNNGLEAILYVQGPLDSFKILYLYFDGRKRFV